jgi:hypothetical protein
MPSTETLVNPHTISGVIVVVTMELPLVQIAEIPSMEEKDQVS